MYAGARTISDYHMHNQDDEMTQIKKRIQAGVDAHTNRTSKIHGEFLADSYGNFKFRQLDESSFVMPNEHFDSDLPQSSRFGQPEYFRSDQF